MKAVAINDFITIKSIEPNGESITIRNRAWVTLKAQQALRYRPCLTCGEPLIYSLDEDPRYYHGGQCDLVNKTVTVRIGAHKARRVIDKPDDDTPTVAKPISKVKGRIGVIVQKEGEKDQEFASVRAAFKALNLPWNKRQSFRAKLKRSGIETIQDYTFTLEATK